MGPSKKQRLPSIGITVNYYSCLVTNKQKEWKLVKKAATNNREIRVRPDDNQKDLAI